MNSKTDSSYHFIFSEKDLRMVNIKTSFEFHYSVIILAAGNGSRLKSSTPKILQKVGGLPLLDHVIKAAKDIPQNNGLERHEIVVVTKPGFLMDQLRYSDGVLQAFQNSQKGTADAVQCGLEILKNRLQNDSKESWILILYGDVPLVSPKTLASLFQVANTCDKTAAVILAMNSNGAENLGNIEESEDGTVKSIIEARDATANSSGVSNRKLLSLCNCGILFRKSVLDRFLSFIQPSPVTNEIYITELIRIAYENGYKCRYFEADSQELSGANTFAELAILERNFQDIMRKKFMKNGVKLVAPETVFFSHDTEIEPDVVINPYVIFGEGVKLKRGAVIGPFCVLEGSNISAATVGPFARIRPGSEIRNSAKIGNFVEIKKSLISEHTKVNHLSYIGDSTVGAGTNIGAGTITCNYDGQHKHQTCIGSEVFVGSNTALVAPVEIGNGAIIGAGSVITDNIPSQSLAIARSRQVNMDNWKKRKKSS